MTLGKTYNPETPSIKKKLCRNILAKLVWKTSFHKIYYRESFYTHFYALAFMQNFSLTF